MAFHVPLVWRLAIALALTASNTAAVDQLIYNITLIRTWTDEIAERPCQDVGYLNIICQEVQLGNSFDFDFLGVVPTPSGSTALLFNATTHNVTHATHVLTALQTLVGPGRLHGVPVSAAIGVIPQPQTDLAVWMVDPVSGPSSGGTSVTVTGYFTEDLELYVGDQQCQTQARSPVLHICDTPALNNVSLINDALDLSYQDGDGVVWPANFTYTYTTDPTVTKVQPLEVILSGGQELTVSGSNLDTVRTPVLQTLVIATRAGSTGSKIYNTACRRSSSTEMICPTATIVLGDVSKRRRRKRQAESVNTREMIDVQISFILDGVPLIQVTDYNRLQVFEDPVLEAFEPPSFTQKLRGNTLTIQGKDLLAALTQADYAVTVGGENCTNIKVLSDQIECEPPSTEPQTDAQASLVPGRIPVIVHYVGQVREVGFLMYPGNTLRNILIGVGVVFFCLIITLVAVVVYCYRKHSNNISLSDPEQTPYTKPVIFAKPGTFRKPPFADDTVISVSLPRATSRAPRGFSQHQSRYQQRGDNDYYQHSHQNGRPNQNGRNNKNSRHDAYERAADTRPSRHVWPGNRQNGNSPGTSAAYVHRSTARSIAQHRARLPEPSRQLHAAVWNWDDHA